MQKSMAILKLFALLSGLNYRYYHLRTSTYHLIVAIDTSFWTGKYTDLDIKKIE